MSNLQAIPFLQPLATQTSRTGCKGQDVSEHRNKRNKRKTEKMSLYKLKLLTKCTFYPQAHKHTRRYSLS